MSFLTRAGWQRLVCRPAIFDTVMNLERIFNMLYHYRIHNCTDDTDVVVCAESREAADKVFLDATQRERDHQTSRVITDINNPDEYFRGTGETLIKFDVNPVCTECDI